MFTTGLATTLAAQFTNKINISIPLQLDHEDLQSTEVSFTYSFILWLQSKNQPNKQNTREVSFSKWVTMLTTSGNATCRDYLSRLLWQIGIMLPILQEKIMNDT